MKFIPIIILCIIAYGVLLNMPYDSMSTFEEEFKKSIKRKEEEQETINELRKWLWGGK